MVSESEREALAAALTTCIVEDGAPVSLLTASDVFHISHMLAPAVDQIATARADAAVRAALSGVAAEIETRAATHKESDAAVGCESRWCDGWTHGHQYAAHVIRDHSPRAGDPSRRE